MASSEIENMIETFNGFTEKPVKFLTVQADLKDEVKNLVKSLYDFTKTQDKDLKREKKGSLAELIVEDFDEEQIWQQIELQNTECWDPLVWEVANCMSIKDLVFPVKPADPSQEANQPMDEDEDEESVSENENIEQEFDKSDTDEDSHTPKNKQSQKPANKVKHSIVDDQFFKLQEMEKFLLNEEKSDGKELGSDSEEDAIDMFEDIDDDDNEDDGNNVMYSDFFDGNQEQNGDENDGESDENENDMDEEMEENLPKADKKKKDKKVRFTQDASSDNDESVDSEAPIEKKPNEKKSEFELRQERLKQQIQKLEEKTMNEASWQLKGEVDANERPQNSLLQEVVDFDVTSRPAPIITEQTTITLEDLIKQRIKDKAWDDVIRKEKPVDDQLSFRKKEVLDHSKSKQSLAQVYEAEYLKQKQAQSGEVEEEKEPESHVEIRDAMSKLFSKLDALCHYHYTPKAPQAEVKIVTKTPAISMEEVAPVATSEAALLAPEEVKKKHRGDLLSKEERTTTDKNRERRKKKKLQRQKGQVTKVTEHRNTKKASEGGGDKSLKTSKAFFQQLNEDSTSLIKNSKNKRNVKSKGQ